jgi:hypothetical protein
MMNLYKKLDKELNIPPQLTQKGKVFVQLSLHTAGNITETVVFRGISKVVDKKVLSAFSAIDIRYTPAKINEQPCATNMAIPVLMMSTNRGKTLSVIHRVNRL